MDISSQKRRIQNRNSALFLMVPTAIFAKIIQLFFLPDKYFFDSWRMVGMLNGDVGVGGGAWGGYQAAVNFHKSVNIMNLTDATQFSIFYGIILMPICIFMVSRVKEMEMKEVAFVLMATGVLNIYVFNINKEVPQFLYFFAIYTVINLPIKNIIKIAGCAGIFYWESLGFRGYYIIMACLVVCVYFIFKTIQQSKKIKIGHIVVIIALLFALVFVFFYLSSYVSPDEYQDALDARSGTTNAIDTQGSAASAIRDWMPVNGSLGIFMIDYVINSARMMVPIELLFKSPGYFPFIIYQIFILSYFFRAIKNIKSINDKVLIALSCFTAYFLGSAVFEPDFGSWTRHEATTFPILQLIALQGDSSNRQEGLVNETEN